MFLNYFALYYLYFAEKNKRKQMYKISNFDYMQLLSY